MALVSVLHHHLKMTTMIDCNQHQISKSHVGWVDRIEQFAILELVSGELHF
jgi:hypothetical protein